MCACRWYALRSYQLTIDDQNLRLCCPSRRYTGDRTSFPQISDRWIPHHVHVPLRLCPRPDCLGPWCVHPSRHLGPRNLTLCRSVRTARAASSRRRGFLTISADFYRPGTAQQHGDSPRDAVLRRGLRLRTLGDWWWRSRRSVGRFWSDHPFRDFLELRFHRPMHCDDSRWFVSCLDPVKKHPFTPAHTVWRKMDSAGDGRFGLR